MPTKIFNYKHYYNAEILKEIYPTLIAKTTNPRGIAKKYNILPKYFVFASLKNGNYYVTDITNKKASLFIKKSYTKKHLVKISKSDDLLISEKMSILKICAKKKQKESEPAIILQTETMLNEKLTNSTELINHKNLQKIVTENNSNIINNTESLKKPKIIVKQKKEAKIENTINQKEILSSKNLGLQITTIKSMLKTFVSPISCIYLFTLGYVVDLRKSMKIPKNYTDNMIVCKYGYTANLYKRSIEHQKTFGNLENCVLSLKYQANINEHYLSKAELELSKYLESINAKYMFDSYKELIIVSKHIIDDSLKCQYISIEKKFCTEIKLVNQKIKEIELSLNTELIKKDAEIMKKEYQINELNQQIKINNLEQLLNNRQEQIC